MNYPGHGECLEYHVVTPLELAASHGHEGVVRLLLERDANHLRGRRRGITLFEAMKRGIRCTMQAFLDHGADVNVHTYRRRIRTSLVAANIYERADVVRVQILLERTDMIRCGKEVCEMAICYAAQLRCVTIVRTLTERGIDPDWLCGEEITNVESTDAWAE